MLRDFIQKSSSKISMNSITSNLNTKNTSQSKPIHFYEYGNFNSLCKPLILYFVQKKYI